MRRDWPWTSVEDVGAAMESQEYVTDRSLATAVYLAVTLGKPLLVEGEPGCGKTEIAKVISSAAHRPLIRLQCYEGLDAANALYEWNYPRQLLTIRLQEARGAPVARDTDLFNETFLLRRPLLQALAGGDQPPVLLIDEIDRADEEFEGLLLEVLSDFQVTIPELGTIRAERPPFVLVTSNRTRELSDALKRRCLYAYLGYPPLEKEVAILRRKVPEMDGEMADHVARLVQRVRAEPDLTKRPGVAETLDWARALLSLGEREVSSEIVQETLGLLVKDVEDLRQLRGRTSDLVRGDA